MESRAKRKPRSRRWLLECAGAKNMAGARMKSNACRMTSA
jgi:hypothetical protein